MYTPVEPTLEHDDQAEQMLDEAEEYEDHAVGVAEHALDRQEPTELVSAVQYDVGSGQAEPDPVWDPHWEDKQECYIRGVSHVLLSGGGRRAMGRKMMQGIMS